MLVAEGRSAVRLSSSAFREEGMTGDYRGTITWSEEYRCISVMHSLSHTGYIHTHTHMQHLPTNPQRTYTHTCTHTHVLTHTSSPPTHPHTHTIVCSSRDTSSTSGIGEGIFSISVDPATSPPPSGSDLNSVHNKRIHTGHHHYIIKCNRLFIDQS